VSGGGGDTAYAHGVAYVAGDFVAAAEARVSIFDHSFLYGDGAFENVAFRGRRLYALEVHLDRLDGSCAYLRLELPLGRGELREVCLETIRRNQLEDGYLRIVASRGEGYPSLDPRKTSGAQLVLSLQAASPAASAPPGRRLVVGSTRRTPASSLDPRAKLNNYGNHVVAKLEAIAAGVDDTVMLDGEGTVAELSAANLFVLRGGELATPPPGAILVGITRETVLRLVGAGLVEGVAAVERRLTPLELYTAEEVILTGTATGIVYAAEIDGRTIGDGGIGPVASRLRELYEGVLDGEEQLRRLLPD
jgi:branched-chain amino acid aminotransferase